MEAWELKQLQSLPLELKIQKSLLRIQEWYEYWNGDVYVSISGGKDSTVLLHLVRTIYPDVRAIFVDTGLEFPENREFVKTLDNVIWIRPKKTFKEIIEKYGYPVISKEQAQYIREYRQSKSEQLREKRWNGVGKYKTGKISDRWKYLVDAPFKISEQCCYHLKEGPVMNFERRTGLKPYIGLLAADSARRKQIYLQTGCNIYDSKRPLSKPLSFWLEQDIWDYIHKYNIPYSKVYDMGYERTGCIFCMFGIHLDKKPNRFQKLKETHPQLWEYCIYKLGLKDVLNYLGIHYQ
jgi:3'-phosphoadenosine 5'-phosphosulfate sulfotransferase (PAPS reductase)/FAD synthetase